MAGGQIIGDLLPKKSSGSSSSTGQGFSTSDSSHSSGFGNMLGFGSEYNLQQIAPLQASYLSTLQAALTKGQIGGVGIPMAQAAIAQARGAAGATMQGEKNMLARSGGADSPFAQQLLSSTAAQGNEAVAQAPVGIYQELLGQIPGFLTTMNGQSMQGLGTAGTLNGTSSAFDTFRTKSQSSDQTKSGSLFGF